ncbi:hypothetical protein [Streptomyces dysideae]|uniref:Transferase n=1 Tax=Streptomyces dysideae TaxID=909626 RepID=A0A101UT66_9ACTN|nr:hypothetical protein [Streptomyces dysideae]KUO16331.1 hypothetical protein AQJ91_36360 [Streptomyces dysideae]
MTTPVSRVAPLRADCIADSAGGLTFDVSVRGAADVAHLVLRRRDGLEEVGLPLTPAADGRLRAALPSSVALPEGRWDAYARVGAGEPRRLAPGVTDLCSLAARTPSGARGHVAVRIPYETRHGNLTVRSWLRAPHAEAGELRLTEGGLTVCGRVYGTCLTPGAYAELRGRHAPDPVRRLAVAAGQTGFRFTVAYAALEPGVWDLWLRPTGEAGPCVRIARLLDDVADKKPVFTYPRVRVRTPYGPVEAGPYYTRDNDLSLSVTPPR